jgi:two-component system, cell cycle sensor histidine kinase and response regulator CckA
MLRVFPRWFHIVGWAGWVSVVLGATDPAAIPSPELPLLSTIQAVSAMTPEQAKRGYPVPVREPAAFRLLMASAGDVQGLQRPPWWSLKHTQRALTLLSLGILAAMGWVVLLRQRVRKQTEHIRRQFEKESALAEQLRQAQKMESVGQLAAGIAHDFNNLLTIIQGRAKLLQLQLPCDQKTLESLKEIEAASRRATNLTRQLLTFSRKQQMLPKPLNLNEVISDVAKMLQRALGEHINLQLNYAPHLPTIYADTGMMEQIIMNLSVNARDAMPKGGQLQIRTQMVNLDPAYVQNHAEARAGQHVCLSVSDTGCGMEQETTRRIFEPFFTTKEPGKGTGLGLAIVHGIVKQHEGWIEVETETGKGSTFKIFLPGSSHTIAPSPTETAKSIVKDGNETILVVEDEAPLRDLMRTILEQHGYRVLEAANGHAALVLWQHQPKPIDLLLTDLVMPDGITGRDLAERLREKKADLKVVYTSGYSVDLFEAGFVLRAGPNFVPKPFSQDQLLHTIRNCLDGAD